MAIKIVNIISTILNSEDLRDDFLNSKSLEEVFEICRKQDDTLTHREFFEYILESVVVAGNEGIDPNSATKYCTKDSENIEEFCKQHPEKPKKHLGKAFASTLAAALVGVAPFASPQGAYAASTPSNAHRVKAETKQTTYGTTAVAAITVGGLVIGAGLGALVASCVQKRTDNGLHSVPGLDSLGAFLSRMRDTDGKTIADFYKTALGDIALFKSLIALSVGEPDDPNNHRYAIQLIVKFNEKFKNVDPENIKSTKLNEVSIKAALATVKTKLNEWGKDQKKKENIDSVKTAVVSLFDELAKITWE
ncbi:MAG: hypothetical protein NkDv07_0959 [Candidatus Improbicoccus devescovinae]|nr:MAG: hypothetical protein NkDv07_0959 [Candidatus Improbicoccus devescovinae]